jgi:hypothetical protein
LRGAFLHDAPSVEDEDPIDVSKKPQLMTDHDHRASLHQPIQARHHVGGGARIQSRGRLIQNDNRRILDDRASYRKTLTLAAAQGPATLPDYGLVALRQSREAGDQACLIVISIYSSSQIPAGSEKSDCLT